MELGIHPIIKAGMPMMPPEYDARDFNESTSIWLRVGETLPLGADVYALQPMEGYRECRNITIEELSYTYPIDLGKTDSYYPSSVKETPIVFAGRTVLDGERMSAAGVLFRSSFRLGWVNIQRPQ